jgi:type I restriction enzyme M protein
MLFLLHLLSKMRPAQEGGSRIGIVLSGSPLFTGAAGSGPSDIRRYIIENDLLEAVVALPNDMFFNTGIATYVWILCNRKPAHRVGQVQLIDASGMWRKMKRSLGSKRRQMNPEHINWATRLFGDFVPAEMATVTDKDGQTETEIVRKGEAIPKAPIGGFVKTTPISKIMSNEEFGFRTITVERPMRDEQGNVVLGQKGKQKGRPIPDPKLRETEDVPLLTPVEDYFALEVLPHAPDAWIDEQKTTVGYEIPFTRHFYVFEAPRLLSQIDADLKLSAARMQQMLEELST